MDRIFILHADHEQNASTSTVRLAGSSGANPFACIAAGIACLWGPAHGGANEAALKMLRGDRHGRPHPASSSRKAKDKNDPFRLMGFGHRVYKNYDPRAKLMQQTADEVLDELGIKDDPLLEVAMELEKIALEDEYFIEKKLYPNVDFYSGIILEGDRLPDLDVHRDLRARPHRRLDRAVEGDDRGPAQKIGRPRQLYTGATAARLPHDRPARLSRPSCRRDEIFEDRRRPFVDETTGKASTPEPAHPSAGAAGVFQARRHPSVDETTDTAPTREPARLL